MLIVQLCRDIPDLTQGPQLQQLIESPSSLPIYALCKYTLITQTDGGTQLLEIHFKSRPLQSYSGRRAGGVAVF